MILEGKSLALKLKNDLKSKVEGNISFSIISVGNDPASEIYVNSKIRLSKEIGINARLIKLPQTTSENELLHLIDKLNNDDSIDGILVQLPLPKQINTLNVISRISPIKDVDGFHPQNIGLLLTGKPRLISATPKGIIYLLKQYKIPIEGKHAVVVGRSNIVGKPVASLLLNENATVTICHSKTKNLAKYTRDADILVVAVGKPNLITKDMVKEGAYVIDVGINRIDGKIVGDCDFENIKKIANITPVPGGVGPLTVAMLIENVIQTAKLKRGLNEGL